MKKLVSAAIAIALATVAWDSSAQTTAGKFGEKGTVALHAATGAPMLMSTTEVSFGATPTLGFSTTRYSDPERCTPAGCTNSRVSVTGFYINPRMHYFVIDNLSIGGEV